MPLPPPVEREPLHVRTIELRGYRRDDGLYDIEGHLTDVKTEPLLPPGRETSMPAGVPVHDIWVRFVIDDRLVIHDIVATLDNGPYADCPSAPASLASLIGAKIGAGWSATVKALRGRESCTHVVELLGPMATAAYQTLAPVRFALPDSLDRSGRPVRIDSCYAYGSDRALVLNRWPAHFTGGNAPRGAPTVEPQWQPSPKEKS